MIHSTYCLLRLVKINFSVVFSVFCVLTMTLILSTFMKCKSLCFEYIRTQIYFLRIESFYNSIHMRKVRLPRYVFLATFNYIDMRNATPLFVFNFDCIPKFLTNLLTIAVFPHTLEQRSLTYLNYLIFNIHLIIPCHSKCPFLHFVHYAFIGILFFPDLLIRNTVVHEFTVSILRASSLSFRLPSQFLIAHRYQNSTVTTFY